MSHGMSRTRTYLIWSAMKQRCFNVRARNYHKYGGKGVTVCREWRAHFARFLADMGECPPNHEIDRIDSEGDYEPGNCRWSTRSDQQHNRRGKIGSSSRFKGVSARRGGWYASINHLKQTFFIGDFAYEEEAALAYNAMAMRLHGDVHALNVVDES